MTVLRDQPWKCMRTGLRRSVTGTWNISRNTRRRHSETSRRPDGKVEKLRSQLGLELEDNGFPLSHRLDDYGATINLQKILDTTRCAGQAPRFTLGFTQGVAARLNESRSAGRPVRRPGREYWLIGQFRHPSPVGLHELLRNPAFPIWAKHPSRP